MGYRTSLPPSCHMYISSWSMGGSFCHSVRWEDLFLFVLLFLMWTKSDQKKAMTRANRTIDVHVMSSYIVGYGRCGLRWIMEGDLHTLDSRQTGKGVGCRCTSPNLATRGFPASYTICNRRLFIYNDRRSLGAPLSPLSSPVAETNVLILPS